jgi:hypothetical protein
MRRCLNRVARMLAILIRFFALAELHRGPVQLGIIDILPYEA